MVLPLQSERHIKLRARASLLPMVARCANVACASPRALCDPTSPTREMTFVANVFFFDQIFFANTAKAREAKAASERQESNRRTCRAIKATIASMTVATWRRCHSARMPFASPVTNRMKSNSGAATANITRARNKQYSARLCASCRDRIPHGPTEPTRRTREDHEPH